MSAIIQHDNIDIIREAIIILAGLIIRWFEKKRINKQNND
jgi:hypothetical protein